MAVTYVNKGTFASGNGAITPGLPSGYTVGNFLLLLVESANEQASNPSGWNICTGQGTGTSGSAGGVRLDIFWCVASAGMSDPTIADTGNHTTAIIFEFSGVETGSPFAGTINTNVGSTATITFGSVNAVYSNPFIVYALANDRDTASTSNLSNWSTGLTSFAQRHDQTVSTMTGGGVAMATGIANVSAGNAIGSSTVTNGAAVNTIAMTIELRPKIYLASSRSTSSTISANLTKRNLHSLIYSGAVPYFGVKYGFIYNWYAVADTRYLAASGWHVPSASDFATLLVYLDPNAGFQNNVAAIPMTEPVTYWITGENIGTNTSKFNARGLYGRSSSGFNALGGDAFWWNSDEANSTHGKFTSITRNDPELYTSAFGLTISNPKYNGYGVRLIKDSTTLSHGQSSRYIGNDGKSYRTICIGTQEWLADNLCETRFRNNDLIPGPEFTNTAWNALTTAGYCYAGNDIANSYSGINLEEYVSGNIKGWGALLLSINPLSTSAAILSAKAALSSSILSGNLFVTGGYGFLYNAYVVRNSSSIANTGWHVPTLTELQTLATYLGGESVAGGKLKEAGYSHWDSPNEGAINEVGFNLRGAGMRSPDNGLFLNSLRLYTYLWSSTDYFTNYQRVMAAQYTNDDFFFNGGGTALKSGLSIRLLKDSTSLSHGQTGTYTGNDGKEYSTICIGTQEWLSQNLLETQFRDKSNIAEVVDNSAWIALSTPAFCAYNNDWAIASYDSFYDGVRATISFTGQALSLISAILTESGIVASLTGKGKLLSNIDGSTTLIAQIEGGGFIPVITFF